MFAGTEKRAFHCGRCERKEQKRQHYWGDDLELPAAVRPSAAEKAAVPGGGAQAAAGDQREAAAAADQFLRGVFVPAQGHHRDQNVVSESAGAADGAAGPGVGRPKSLGVFAEDREPAGEVPGSQIGFAGKKVEKEKKRKRRRERGGVTTYERKSRRWWGSKAADATWRFLEYFTDETYEKSSREESDLNLGHEGMEDGLRRSCKQKSPVELWWNSEPPRTCERCADHCVAQHQKQNDHEQRRFPVMPQSPNSQRRFPVLPRSPNLYSRFPVLPQSPNLQRRFSVLPQSPNSQRRFLVLPRSPNSQGMRKHAETVLMKRLLAKKEEEDRLNATFRSRLAAAAGAEGFMGAAGVKREGSEGMVMSESARKKWENWRECDLDCLGCRKHHKQAESARASPGAKRAGVGWLLTPRATDADRGAILDLPGDGENLEHADGDGDVKSNGDSSLRLHGAQVLSPSERFANKWREKNLSLRWWEPGPNCKGCLKHHELEADALAAEEKDGNALLAKTVSASILKSLDIYLPPGGSHTVAITENDAKIKNKLKPINTARESVEFKVKATLPCTLHSKNTINESAKKAKANHARNALKDNCQWWISEKRCDRCLTHQQEKAKHRSCHGKRRGRRRSVKFRLSSQSSRSPRRRRFKLRTFAKSHGRVRRDPDLPGGVLGTGNLKDGNMRRPGQVGRHDPKDCKRCSRHHEACALLMEGLARADLGLSPMASSGAGGILSSCSKGGIPSAVEKHEDASAAQKATSAPAVLLAAGPLRGRLKEGPRLCVHRKRKPYRFNPFFSPPEPMPQTNDTASPPRNFETVQERKFTGISLTSNAPHAHATATSKPKVAQEEKTPPAREEKTPPAKPSQATSRSKPTSESGKNHDQNQKRIEMPMADRNRNRDETPRRVAQTCPCIGLCREVGVQVAIPASDKTTKGSGSGSSSRSTLVRKNPWPELRAPPRPGEARKQRIKELEDHARRAKTQRNAERLDRILRSSQELHEKQLRQALLRAPRVAPVGYEWREGKHKDEDGSGSGSGLGSAGAAPAVVIAARPLHRLKFNVWGSGPDRPISASSLNEMRGPFAHRSVWSGDSIEGKDARRRRKEDTKVRTKRDEQPKYEFRPRDEQTKSELRLREEKPKYENRAREEQLKHENRSREEQPKCENRLRGEESKYEMRSREEQPKLYESWSRQEQPKYQSRSREEQTIYEIRSRDGKARYESRLREEQPTHESRSNPESSASSASEDDHARRLYKGRYAGPSKRLQRKICKSDHRERPEFRHTAKTPLHQQPHGQAHETPKSPENISFGDSKSHMNDVHVAHIKEPEKCGNLRIGDGSEASVNQANGPEEIHLKPHDEALPNPVLHPHPSSRPTSKEEPSIRSKTNETSHSSSPKTTRFDLVPVYIPLPNTQPAAAMEGSRPWCSMAQMPDCITGQQESSCGSKKKKTNQQQLSNVPKLDLRLIRDGQQQNQASTTPSSAGSHRHDAASAPSSPSALGFVPSIMSSCFGGQRKQSKRRGNRRDLDRYLAQQTWSSSGSASSTTATSSMKSEASQQSSHSSNTPAKNDLNSPLAGENLIYSNSSGVKDFSSPGGKDFIGAEGRDFNSPGETDFNSPGGKDFNSQGGQDFNSPGEKNFNNPPGKDFNSSGVKDSNSALEDASRELPKVSRQIEAPRAGIGRYAPSSRVIRMSTSDPPWDQDYKGPLVEMTRTRSNTASGAFSIPSPSSVGAGDGADVRASPVMNDRRIGKCLVDDDPCAISSVPSSTSRGFQDAMRSDAAIKLATSVGNGDSCKSAGAKSAGVKPACLERGLEHCGDQKGIHSRNSMGKSLEAAKGAAEGEGAQHHLGDGRQLTVHDENDRSSKRWALIEKTKAMLQEAKLPLRN